MAIITLKEYAERLGVNPTVASHKAQRGGFVTAHKVGRDWLIDEDEPYTDGRIRSGRYLDARKRRGKNLSLEAKAILAGEK